jgi:phosphatidylinositol 4-kinase
MATIVSGAEYHGNEQSGATSAVTAASERHKDIADGQTRSRDSGPSGTDASPSGSGETPTTVLANNRSPAEEEGDATSTIDVYGEKWADRKERIRKRSPHGTRPGWDLAAVIVKDGDDCRQELLSMQLIRTFQSIFQEAGLPLWLRPYDILVTSNLTALIEMIPNAPSIHNVKSSFVNQDMTLRGHFLEKYGRDGERTPEFDAAQNNFVESMAAYSLLCYVLQLRDRHNGNMLLDDQGHVIHIDFGFMLSNSPGGVNFESAPFKLTRELLEVMDSDSDGTSSKPFDYFKVLMIQGFVAICKHSDRVIELVSMMSESGCPCFRNKQLAVEGLRKRISTRMSEEKYVDHVLGLISEALDNWRTRQYDYYQRILNGIR